MTSNATEILVVGAGPTGLTIAAELRRRGIACRIIEREAAANPQSRALAMHARTLEMFDIMGIAEDFVNRGLKLKAFNVYDQKQHIVRMTFDELPSRFPYVLSLRQSDTEELLTNHLHAWGGQIEWETTLAALTQESDHVTVRIKGADGEEEAFDCKWVIGCDGAHSSVRHFLGLAFDGKKYPEYYVLADVEFETSLDISEFYIFSSGQSIGGFHPFSKEGARIFADVDESAQTLPDLNQIQSMLDARGPGSVKVTKLNWISMHHVHQRQVKDYRHGRVFLAGDAAHVHSPASGQGMNLGIQDAFNLAWKLALVHQGLASERLLDSYSPERRNAGRKVLTMTDFFTRINTMPTKVAQKVRNIVGPMIAKNDFVRQRYRTAVTQLSANYKGSPIVEDHLSHPEASAAGDRAADAVFVQAADKDQKLRLYELLRDQKHHLFMLAGPHPTAGDLHNFQELRNHVATNYPKSVASHVVFEQLEAMPGPEWAADALFDCDRSMLDAYALNGQALLLIRPDGFVGFRGGSVGNHDAVQKYLERVLNLQPLLSATT